MREALQTLKKYVSMPSGSWDKEDTRALAEEIAADLAALSMGAKIIPGDRMGPVLEATYGHGPRQLMLMGHMDTVFPHDECQPFRVEGNIAYGSGVS